MPLLADYFIDVFNREFRKKVKGHLARGRGALLRPTSWEGNVRELRNALERAMLFAEIDELTPKDFPTISTSAGPSTLAIACPRAASTSTSWSAAWSVRPWSAPRETAPTRPRLLGMTRDRMRYRIEKFGLD